MLLGRRARGTSDVICVLVAKEDDDDRPGDGHRASREVAIDAGQVGDGQQQCLEREECQDQSASDRKVAEPQSPVMDRDKEPQEAQGDHHEQKHEKGLPIRSLAVARAGDRPLLATVSGSWLDIPASLLPLRPHNMPIL
jgi:hypothetical protein